VTAVSAFLAVAPFFVSTPVPCRSVGGDSPAQLSARQDPAEVRRHAGRAVHVRGRLYAVELEDHEFLLVRRGVRLERHVEMFQWHPDGRGGYRKGWLPYLVDSRDHAHGHLNPLAMPFENHTQISLPVRLAGAAGLSFDRALNPLLAFGDKAPVDAEDLARLPAELQGTLKALPRPRRPLPAAHRAAIRTRYRLPAASAVCPVTRAARDRWLTAASSAGATCATRRSATRASGSPSRATRMCATPPRLPSPPLSLSPSLPLSLSPSPSRATKTCGLLARCARPWLRRAHPPRPLRPRAPPRPAAPVPRRAAAPPAPPPRR
jgi:hypothetical protein